MWRSGVLILALSLARPALGQQKDNASQIGTDHNSSHADQPPSPNEVVKAMGEIAVPQLPPMRPRSAKLAAGSLGNEQVKQLINQVAEKDIENDKRQRNYTYTQRQELHKLDGKGQPKSTETETHEVMMLYGEQVERLVAKDDKPLSEKDQKKEARKLLTKERTKATSSARSGWKKKRKTASTTASSCAMSVMLTILIFLGSSRWTVAIIT